MKWNGRFVPECLGAGVPEYRDVEVPETRREVLKSTENVHFLLNLIIQ